MTFPLADDNYSTINSSNEIFNGGHGIPDTYHKTFQSKIKGA